MTDDDKALVERLREEADEWDEQKSHDEFDMRGMLHSAADRIEALSADNERLFEQHEAFRQEVSDAVESLCNTVLMSHGHRQLREMLSHRFILPKPNPLVEAVKDILDDDSLHNAEEFSEAIRAALAKRGLEIRDKSDD